MRALVDAHGELRELSPNTLAAIGDTSPVSASLTDLHARATDTIQTHHYDATELLQRAAAMIGERPGLTVDLGAVVLAAVAVERLVRRVATRAMAMTSSSTILPWLGGTGR